MSGVAGASGAGQISGPAAAAPPLLEGRGLGAARGGRPVLSGVDVAVRPGERVAVTGPSGSGKTTLLTLLAGLEPPTAGEVLLGGVPLRGPGPGIAIVLQGYGLLSLLTAAENVAVAVRAAGRTPRQALAAADEALERVGLGDRRDHLTGELSGGQQQRVAVARAIAVRPRVLLADESTAEQDAEHRDLVVRALLDGLEPGAALVIATHDPQIAARCDRRIALRQGMLVP